MHSVIPLSAVLLALASFSIACTTVTGVDFTAYGFPDAAGIPAYKCSGNQVVPTEANDRTEIGDGSFGSPYASAAASNSVFKRCDLLYIPLLKKYFRVQENCSGCASKQADLYIVQSNEDIGQLPCEQQFGAFNYGGYGHQVIQNPGPGLEVMTAPLFDSQSKQCFNNPSDGRVFPDRDGQVQCSANGNGPEVSPTNVGGSVGTTIASCPSVTNPAALHRRMKLAPPSAKFRI